MKKSLRPLMIVLLTVYTIFLFFRSVVYFIRIIKEFPHPHAAFLPSISTCKPLPPNASPEEIHTWNYRNLGAMCEN